MSRRAGWSALRFFLGVVLLVGAVTALMGRITLRQTRERFLSEMRLRAEFFGRSAREALFPKLDPFNLQFALHELVKQPGVIYAGVHDAAGRIVIHSNPALIGGTEDTPQAREALETSVTALRTERRGEEAVHEVAVPLRVGPQRVGTARVGYHDAVIRTAVRDVVRTILLNASGVLAGGVALAVLLALAERRKRAAVAESVDTSRTLGLAFQSQGMLDLAWEKFRRCPVDDAMKPLLYNLGLDFERKRQFAKAAAAYEAIAEAEPGYKDIAKRIAMAKQAASVTAGGVAPMEVLVDAHGVAAPTLGRYEIVRELGRGAMGIVYLGKDPKLNRTVAIKTLRFGEDIDPAEREPLRSRFYREAEAAGRLSHPHIVKVFDAGEDHGVCYIAMELLEGETLESDCRPGALRPLPEVLETMAAVAEALDYAHAAGVVHRDVKPANLMRLRDGSVRVTDFGVSRLAGTGSTGTGMIVGTLGYMAPEQVAGRHADGRADVFSLGVVLYQMVTGRMPFQGETAWTLLFAIVNQPHDDPRRHRPDLPEAVVAILDHALQKAPEARIQTAGEFAAACRHAIPSASANPPPAP